MSSSTAPRGWQVWAGLWVVYVVWGSTYFAIRVVVETLPPFLAAGTRFLAASAVLALVVRLRRGGGVFRVTRAQLGTACLVGLLLCMGGNGFVMIAEQSVPSGLSALLVACVPLFVVLLRLTGRERPAAMTLVGVGIGLVGVAVLLLPGTTPSGARGWHLAANVFAPFCWSVGSYLATRRPMPADPFVASVYEMLAGGLALAVTGLLQGDRVGHVSRSSAVAWVYLVLAGSLVAFTAYVWLLSVAPVSQVATYAYVNPVVAVLLGAVLGDERVTLGAIVGGAVIVVAVAVVVGEDSRARRSADLSGEPVPPG